MKAADFRAADAAEASHVSPPFLLHTTRQTSLPAEPPAAAAAVSYALLAMPEPLLSEMSPAYFMSNRQPLFSIRFFRAIFVTVRPLFRAPVLIHFRHEPPTRAAACFSTA